MTFGKIYIMVLLSMYICLGLVFADVESDHQILFRRSGYIVKFLVTLFWPIWIIIVLLMNGGGRSGSRACV